MLRTFIAIEISSHTKDALKKVIAKFKKSDASVKWVWPDNLHITLKFIGDINEADVPEISRVIQECAVDIKPFDITIGGLGGFPNLLKPRVIFVNIKNEKNYLATLFTKLNNRLADLGVKRESRKYEPHLTIGRVKSLKNIDSLSEMIEAEGTGYFGSEYIESVVFMMSELLPAGTRYTKLDTIELKN